MLLKKYLNQIQPFIKNQEVFIMSTGLLNEIHEFGNNPSTDELGDVCWYGVNFCNLAGITLPVIIENKFAVPRTNSELNDKAQRLTQLYRKTKERDYGQRPASELIDQAAVEFWQVITDIAVNLGGSLESILADNVQKLSSRHG